MTARLYTAAEVDAAIEALGDPERFAHAQEIVTHLAPGLQRVLLQALAEGGWFGDAHRAELSRSVAIVDEAQRLAAVQALLAEETRMGMLVGVAVGLELAGELERQRPEPPKAPTTNEPPREETT